MSTPFAPLLTPQRILLFYAARFLIKACCAGFFSVAALWVSTLLPNVFVALASPLLLNYLWENVAIFLKLPAPLLFASVAKGNIPIQDSLLWTVLYPRGAVHRAGGGVRGAVYGGGQKEAGAWLNCARPRCWRPTTFKKWPVNPRVYVVFLLELAYVHWMVSPVGDFCAQGGYTVGLGCSPSSWRSPTPG